MKKAFLIGLSALALSSCDYFKPKLAPLPGERISVLQHQTTLQADQEIAGERILLPQPVINANWPQAGGLASNTMHHLAVGDNLTEAWSTDIGAGSGDEERLSGEPVIYEGRIFAIDSDSELSALDARTGKPLWSRELAPDEDDDGHIPGGLAADRGRIYVSTGFAQVISLDAESGKEIWRVTLDAPMRSAPTVRGGRLFVITLNNKIYALNAETGEELWAYAGIPETASILGGASPAVDRGIVIAPYSSGQIVALRVDNGRLLWEDSLSSVRRTDVVSTLADIRGRPAIDGNQVIAMSNGGQIASIDLRTGRRQWARDIGGLESPWIAGNYIYALTNDYEIVCLSKAEGRIYWVQSLPRYENPEDLTDPIIWTGPVLASDRLIVAGSNGEAYAISPYSGEIMGIVELPDQVSIPPVVANGTVYFLADDGNLVAYR